MALDRILHLNETFLEQPKQTDIESYDQQAHKWDKRFIKTFVMLYVLMNTVSEFMQLHASDNHSPVYTIWTRKIQGHSY